MKYEVRTLDAYALREAAEKLMAMAEKDFSPNLLIGIRSGGYVVAEAMSESIGGRILLLPITRQRPSTEKKKQSAGFKEILARMPYLVTNRLRVLEHRLLTEWKPKAPKPSFVPDPAEIAEISYQLQQLGKDARILIIDDSVDSGATLLVVRDTIVALADEEAEVRTASVTITTPSPLIQPDFFLYQYVLCRFPWSFDFRG